jgi:hypothetical protein
MVMPTGVRKIINGHGLKAERRDDGVMDDPLERLL